MDIDEQAHNILDLWQERVMSSPIHQRIAAKVNEDLQKGVEAHIDELTQSAANEHADSIMLSILGQAIDDYAIARATLTRIQERLGMLSKSISKIPVSDDMSEYVSMRIHTIHIEEIRNAIIEAAKSEQSDPREDDDLN